MTPSRRNGAAPARRLLSLALGAIGAAGAACATGARPPGEGGNASASSNGAPPVLASLAPDTIRLGRGEAPTLTLSGSGFAKGSTGGSGGFSAGGNTVRVGPTSFDGLPADPSGSSIRFVMPLSYTDTAARGRPSSFAPGTFPVSVTTPHGTSNALPLVMIP